MSTQLLFYEEVVPVSSERHKDWCIDGAESRYDFARHVNSVPLTAVEIPFAAREYCIVFAGEDSIVPVVILGVEGNQNLFVKDDGSWDASYIPAFVRRYPFVFSKNDDGSRFTLCIDESWKGCNQEGKGAQLFDEEGGQTPHLQKVLSFLQEYQGQFQRTQAYCQKLKDLDLLKPMQAQLKLGADQRQLTGFMAVDRAKLKELPADELSALAKTDELELVYTHLQSMNNFQAMAQRVADRRAGGSDGSTPDTPEEQVEAEASTTDPDVRGVVRLAKHAIRERGRARELYRAP